MQQESLLGKTILGYHVEKLLGAGAFGTVYKVVKRNITGEYVRALKHITIPTKQQYYDVLNSMGGDRVKVDSYFAEMLKGIVSEIQILNELTEKGVKHIVRYYENDVIATDSPRRFDIYILMEYLTPLPDYIQRSDGFCVRDVIKLGTDVLEGLQLCHENGIIHRDIKNDNILISDDGEYKIGDFGISKVLKDSSRAESVKGTPNFLAPEVYLGKAGYTKSVDLYSLGIVLYRLLNYSRNPFLPHFPNQYFSQDEEDAFEKRMKGYLPDPPSLGGDAIGGVIVKALAGSTERYQAAGEFLDALRTAADCTPKEILGEKISFPSLKNDETEIDDDATLPDQDETVPESFHVPAAVHYQKTNIFPYIFAIIVFLCMVLLVVGVSRHSSSDAGQENEAEVSEIQNDGGRDGTTEDASLNESGGIVFSLNYDQARLEEGETLNLKAEFDGAFEGKITWSSSDESIARVVAGEDYTAQVSYVSEGECRITASAGNGLAECAVQCLASSSYADTEIETEGEIVILRNTEILLVGDETKLSLSAGSWLLNGESDSILWNVQDENVASISPDGTLLAKSAGIVEVTAIYNGQETSTQIRVAEVNEDYGFDIVPDAERITLSAGDWTADTSDVIEMTVSGNVPEHLSAYYYVSPGCELNCEWGELQDNVLSLKISPLYDSTGVLTVFVTPENEPDNVIGVCRVSVKIV